MDGLELEVLKEVKECRCAHSKVREEMRMVVARIGNLEVLVRDMSTMANKENEDIDQRVSRLEMEDRNETELFSRMEGTLEELRDGLQDCQLSRRNNLFFHGLTILGEETQAILTEHIRHILHSKLGISRAMLITRVARVTQSHPVLGCQPVLVTFLRHSHKDEVLKKAALLPRLSGILITEDKPKASLVSPRERMFVSSNSTAVHPRKEQRVQGEKMKEEKHKDEVLPKMLPDQYCEGPKKGADIQLGSLSDVEEEENRNNEKAPIQCASAELCEAQLDDIVFDPGNVMIYEAANFYERNAIHVKDTIGDSVSDDADDDKPHPNESIRSERKNANEHKTVIESIADDEELSETEPEIEATDEAYIKESGPVVDQEETVFDFFD